MLAVGVAVGATGCSLVAPVATLKHYDASDGVSGNVGDINVRNALVISDNGKTGNLVVTLVNTGDDDQKVEIQPQDGTASPTSITVKAGADNTTVVGEGKVRVQLSGMNTKPGALLSVFFQYGSQTGVQLKVPVLTNAIEQYSSLTPTPTPKKTATPTPTATPGATDTATPTPTETPAAG